MTSTELLEEIKTITNNNIELIKTRFAKLSDEQKKWKAQESSWNINEIFAHLNQFAIYYQLTFKIKIARTKFKTPAENFVSSPLGRSVWKSMKLGNAHNVKRKMKAVKSYNPSLDPSLVKGNDVEEFEKNMYDLQEIIESAKKVNLRKIKIPISISKIIRLKLGDAFLFVVYHNERHLQQALNVVNNPKFPK
ncbi:MAG: DinB family protein [Bacteroidota bacterium]